MSFFAPDPPSAPAPVTPLPDPVEPDPARIAREERRKDKQRRGRASLRIEPTISTGASTGLGINSGTNS